jgi:hypothetical protein
LRITAGFSLWLTPVNAWKCIRFHGAQRRSGKTAKVQDLALLKRVKDFVRCVVRGARLGVFAAVLDHVKL